MNTGMDIFNTSPSQKEGEFCIGQYSGRNYFLDSCMRRNDRGKRIDSCIRRNDKKGNWNGRSESRDNRSESTSPLSFLTERNTSPLSFLTKRQRSSGISISELLDSCMRRNDRGKRIDSAYAGMRRKGTGTAGEKAVRIV
jgi:hypothetical protein